MGHEMDPFTQMVFNRGIAIGVEDGKMGHEMDPFTQMVFNRGIAIGVEDGRKEGIKRRLYALN